jgi:hypothetical protein
MVSARLQGILPEMGTFQNHRITLQTVQVQTEGFKKVRDVPMHCGMLRGLLQESESKLTHLL